MEMRDGQPPAQDVSARDERAEADFESVSGEVALWPVPLAPGTGCGRRDGGPGRGRRRMWSAVAAGGTAIACTGGAAVPAAAAGGVSFGRVAVNGRKPIVIGVKEVVEVQAVFRMTTKLGYDSGPTVFPCRGKPDAGDTLHSAVITSGCEIVDRAKGICDFEEWLYADPRDLDFGNSDGGRLHVRWTAKTPTEFEPRSTPDHKRQVQCLFLHSASAGQGCQR
ncbi:hypothetical protein [Streptomyces sp. AC558_RSS880]|uniref:hypothetical protein n=1 Tax=Streptomyces sp. AC558_RSS880 TaxID=2823687 RepID=UPI001C223934|nr:hypothetical protein [Streptomyces sp. AC558_RSS880]